MRKETVLLVDGEKNTLDVIQNMLGDTCQVLHADTGEAGVALYAQHQPLLTLLDLHLPAMEDLGLLGQIQASSNPNGVVVILSDASDKSALEACSQRGISAFLRKPLQSHELKGMFQQALATHTRQRTLEEQTQQIKVLTQARDAMRHAMNNLLTVRVAPGIFWLQVPEAGLSVLCGCPGEVVKHLMLHGLIQKVDKEGVTCETGPNVILLSELLVQNGGFANLAEFPVLQMLYRQGMIIPGHPNNTGVKPMLMGAAPQVKAQMEYIHRGNYGLISKEELLACGVEEATAEIMMKVKLKFAFGTIRPPSELLDTLEVDKQPRLIRNGVTVCRVGFNRYQFAFRGRTAEIDLNLPPNVLYPPAYALGNYRFRRQYFAVLHRGEGDGWDPRRPSMGSVIMFQGRIYLVDAAPGVFYSMMALGIDISEVEGIFHTHGHDDHFAGLPALIHADHRLKYFATPPVRSAVAKKFTALMSLEEEKFEQFFDICDLAFDTWNDCDGLEVMPLYSPHPTETNLLLFRALDGEGYKTYAHWADLSSFKVLDAMVGEGPDDVPAAFMEKVKRDYKYPAHLKKLDIGGGMIHGMSEDFRDDPSERLIMAHLDRKLTIEEMAVGSETSFGAMDILIPGGQNYLYQRAFHYLHGFFPEVDVGQIHMLLNAPVLDYNVGSILGRSGDAPESVDMIVAGTVAFLASSTGVRNHLSFGSLIGMDVFFGKQTALVGTYRAFSHCSVIRFSPALFRAFLENNGILETMGVLLDKVQFLLKTWLFGEQTTFASLVAIARSMEHVSFPVSSDCVIDTAEPGVWLVMEGEVAICDAAGRTLEVVMAGGVFGEHTCFSRTPCPWTFRAHQAAHLHRLHFKDLLKIPIVHWKALEIFEKRNRSLCTLLA